MQAPKVILHYRLTHLTGDGIGDKFGLCYDGDVSPVPYGGIWYHITPTTVADGYVYAVRLMDVDGVMCLDALTISLPDSWESLFTLCNHADISGDGCDAYGNPIAPDIILRMIVCAADSYGMYDVNQSVFVQTEPDGETDHIDNCVRMTENQLLNLAMQWMSVGTSKQRRAKQTVR